MFHHPFHPTQICPGGPFLMDDGAVMASPPANCHARCSAHTAHHPEFIAKKMARRQARFAARQKNAVMMAPCGNRGRRHGPRGRHGFRGLLGPHRKPTGPCGLPDGPHAFPPHGAPHGPCGPRGAGSARSACMKDGPKGRAFKKRMHHEDCGDAIKLSIDLPGVKSEDLQVRVEKAPNANFFVLSGSRKRGEETFEFYRRMKLAKSVDLSELKAHLEDGVLLITVPKAQIGEPEVKIAVSTGDKPEAPTAVDVKIPASDDKDEAEDEDDLSMV